MLEIILALLLYAEIVLSDLLKEAKWLFLNNQSGLFQHSVHMLQLHFFMVSAVGVNDI